MANIASTATNFDHSSDAGFRAWVAEIVTALFTTLSLTQTADTGQINPATVNRPAPGSSPGTSGGYVIGRFNDTLQSTSPIFFKMEFGTNSVSATAPIIWITVGTGSNGSGTITGTTTARSAVTTSVAINSITATYFSNFSYNATQGVFSMAWKANAAVDNYGFLILTRSTDSTGAPTGDAYGLITNSSTATSVNGSAGAAQWYSYLTSTLLPLSRPDIWVLALPFLQAVTLSAGSIQVGCGFQSTPVLGLNGNFGAGILAEVPVGVTISVAFVGTSARTYLGVGHAWNNANIGGFGNAGLLILWQ